MVPGWPVSVYPSSIFFLIVYKPIENLNSENFKVAPQNTNITMAMILETHMVPRLDDGPVVPWN